MTIGPAAARVHFSSHRNLCTCKNLHIPWPSEAKCTMDVYKRRAVRGSRGPYRAAAVVGRSGVCN